MTALSSTFHDENLISITAANNTLVLVLSKQGETVRITMQALEKLRVSDFKEGNIISSMRTISPEPSEACKTEARSLIMHACDLDETSLKINSKPTSFLDKKLTEYRSGAIIILEIEASYGAYLVAIGKSITEN